MKALLVPLVLLGSCAAPRVNPAPVAPAPGVAPVNPQGTEFGMPLPPPAALHPFLRRFVGTWDIRTEMPGGPDGSPMVMRAVETVGAIGPWIHSSLSAQGSHPYTARLSIAHDADKGFIGTWIDSSAPTLWLYQCRIDRGGRTFIAEAQGPSFDDPDRITNFRDITEFVGENRRLLRSQMLDANGDWVEFSSGVAVRR